MSVKPLTEHLLEVLCLKGGCTGSSESTLVKMPHCWKSHAAAQMLLQCEFSSRLQSAVLVTIKIRFVNFDAFESCKNDQAWFKH